MSDLIYTNGAGLRMFLNTAGSRALSVHVESPHIRFKVTHGHVPQWSLLPIQYTLELVSEDVSGDVYDFISNYLLGTSYNPTIFNYNMKSATKSNVLEIIDIVTANLASNYNSLASLCLDFTNLTSVCNIDCSRVQYISSMFENCTSLTTIPTFTNVTTIYQCNKTCYGCTNIESGALALYNQLNALGIQSWAHSQTFYNCGSNTVAGAAELAQIPSDWK